MVHIPLLRHGRPYRSLDVAGVDADGQESSFFPRGNSLGVVLPSNSPGVHSLWIPAFALKVPLVLKPGGAEPWTPYRIIQALIRAGAPASVFCCYPADHAGGGDIQWDQPHEGNLFDHLYARRAFQRAREAMAS